MVFKKKYFFNMITLIKKYYIFFIYFFNLESIDLLKFNEIINNKIICNMYRYIFWITK